MEELTVWLVFPTVAILMYRSSALVPLDSCLTAAACLSSACSFAVSQASDFMLLVGYVAYEDFITLLNKNCLILSNEENEIWHLKLDHAPNLLFIICATYDNGRVICGN